MPKLQENSHSNQLLNLLDDKSRLAFIQQCELITLETGTVLGNIGDEIESIYCPVSCIISWETQLERSAHLLISVIGNEGMLCINSLLEVNQLPCRAVVRKTGLALRMTNSQFKAQLTRAPALEMILKQYIFVSYKEAVQTAACNLFHHLEQRLAALLLMLDDKSHADELIITQELLSQMLGVRRVGVTKAAGALQHKNLIHYSRGHVAITDRIGLTHIACSCYQLNLERYQEILHTH